MGFVKRGEFEALKEEVARLKMNKPAKKADAPKKKKKAKEATPKKASKK
jgi:hypothetical protein